MTSRSLWSRCDRHFVGITRYNSFELNGEDLSCYSNKVESVSLNVRRITDLPTKRI